MASPERAAKRSLGAAVYVRGKGRVQLHCCSITSESGFGVWVIQKGRAHLATCDLSGSGRSAVVSFDQSAVRCEDCTITDATPHALCARGRAQLVVRRTIIANASDRAIYCYHSASLDVSDSHISGTRSPTAAAVQIEALRPDDAASVAIARTVFVSNVGGDLSVAGNVLRQVGSEVRAVEVQAASAWAASAVRDEHGQLQQLHARRPPSAAADATRRLRGVT